MPQAPKQPGKIIRRAALHTIAGCLLLAFASGVVPSAHANPQPNAPQAVDDRLDRLYNQISLSVGLPWQTIAAIDRYERTLNRAHPTTRPLPTGALVSVYIPESRWSGELNPNLDDIHPAAIRFFGGIGRDGNGDGIADRKSDADVLFTIASRLREYGTHPDDFAIGLWEYYHNTRAVQRVTQFAKLYDTFDKLDPNRHAFPVPLRSSYSYRSTWGYSRSWGGYRIHEGTDIFAGYGVPVRSTSYGVVELKGWNRYGGWRIGIRDLDNLYHYYAHLSGYDKKLKAGDVVAPGQVIGWVGSSGYGRPGTQGKFPPHLHYGIYRDRGWVEWAFDPYPLLRKWEREERQARRVTRER